MSPALEEGGGKKLSQCSSKGGRELGQRREQEIAEGHLSLNYTFVLSPASS